MIDQGERIMIYLYSLQGEWNIEPLELFLGLPDKTNNYASKIRIEVLVPFYLSKVFDSDHEWIRFERVFVFSITFLLAWTCKGEINFLIENTSNLFFSILK